MPAGTATTVGKWVDFVEKRGKEPLVKLRFESDKAARELGYQVSPLEPAIADAISWFRANRML